MHISEIGVANNKLLAKMASDFAKPDKIHTLYINEIKQKMWPLSVSELFMLGRRTVPKLQNMQIRTIGDLANTNKEVMVKKFGIQNTSFKRLKTRGIFNKLQSEDSPH